MQWNNTSFSKLLNIEYPIVQGPFGGGMSSPALTAIVSNAGGLGSFGAQPYKAEEILKMGDAIKKLTKRPFNINLWVQDRDPDIAAFNNERFNNWLQVFRPFIEELNLPLPEFPEDNGPHFEEQVQAIFELRPAVFSFVYGIPPASILEECKSLGIKTMGTATNVVEAVALENAGVDAIVATGMEAGGHRVSFLLEPQKSLMGTFSLIPQVADAVSIPVVAAGGIADARGIRAALNLGASGVQIGTAFLGTMESNASSEHKEILFMANGVDTTLTSAFTGRLSRGIRNRLTEAIAGQENLLAPYPLQGKLMSRLYKPDYSDMATIEYRAFWAGQSVSLLKYRKADELMKALISAMDQ